MPITAPSSYPGPIRTDTSNPFARHTMAVRVPAILASVLEANRDYGSSVREAVVGLAEGLKGDGSLPGLGANALHAEPWPRELARRAGETWLGTDWFFAETYAYRCLIERTHYWQTGRDPFGPTKLAETSSEGFGTALQAALELGGACEERLHALLGASWFGNRMDLSFAAARERGTLVHASDCLADQRELGVEHVLRSSGAVHIVCDNAGTELAMDLALTDYLLDELKASVVLHVKRHPTFVSDATAEDVHAFLQGSLPATARTSLARRALARLSAAREAGLLLIEPHLFWNGPEPLWQMPSLLKERFAQARLVILKGDANYRRALGDALWPATTPFADVTDYFPAPLLALRMLKSDPIIGLRAQQVEELDASDAEWRVNGRRGVASLGGAPALGPGAKTS